MDRHSDLEELLEDSPDAQPRTWSFPGRVLLVLGVVGLAGLGLLTFKASNVKLRSKSGSFVGLQEADVDDVDEDGETGPDNCFEMAMYYSDPVKMEGTERTIELSAELCQQRCQVVPECQHFTFWPDGGCLLTGEGSYTKPSPVKYSDTTVGPKFCPGAIKAAQDAIAAGGVASGLQDAVGAASGVVNSVVQSGVQQAESSWGGLTEAKTAVAAAVAAGVNGTTCSAYPACVDVGIKEGDCCPNADNVILGCCNGFPKTIEEVVIKVGTECSKYPKCVALNITGGCCPTNEGLMLGCCDIDSI